MKTLSMASSVQAGVNADCVSRGGPSRSSISPPLLERLDLLGGPYRCPEVDIFAVALPGVLTDFLFTLDQP